MSILDDLQNQTVDINDFLSAQGETAILSRMFGRLPKDLDISHGGYIWDALFPTSAELAIAYIVLLYSLRVAFIQSSHGEYLSLQSAAHGTPRRPAQAATGAVTVSGTVGTLIPAGTKFSTSVPKGSNDPPKYYTTVESAIIPESGAVDIPIRADIVGDAGNVRAEEITLNTMKLGGIVSVVNTEALINGVDEEADDVLIPRALERVRNPPSSGNKADYRRWAREADGNVGDAIIKALWNGAGTVKVVLVGIDGEPVDNDTIAIVQEYIDPEENGTGDGKAPIGAHVTVSTVSGIPVDVSIPAILLEGEYSIADVLPGVQQAVRKYLALVPAGGIVRIKELEAVITEAPGVLDFQTITINGVSANLQLSEEEKAVIGEVMIE